MSSPEALSALDKINPKDSNLKEPSVNCPLFQTASYMISIITDMFLPLQILWKINLSTVMLAGRVIR